MKKADLFCSALFLCFAQGVTLSDNQSRSRLAVHQGWAKWSEWSPCSSSCGGGVSMQLRRCLDVRCVGPSHRERVCNTQLCDKAAIHPRETHCSKLDSYALVNGQPALEKWVPIEATHQCSIRCRSVLSGLERELKKLNDGTPCETIANNVSVCLNGTCRRVGCDGFVGSNARFDQCGVCGGNGDTCARTAFAWKDTKQFSPCDATCGPNSYRVSVSVCHNVRTGRVVPERLCADRVRPRPVVEKCPHVVCPAKWMSGEWSECTVTCGGGHQSRAVYCVESHNDSAGVTENAKVADQYCWESKRPYYERKCSKQRCPEWMKGDWTACSVTCGKGWRTRLVECRQEGERVEQLACSQADIPDEKQPCYTGLECPNELAQSSVGQPNPAIDRYRYLAEAPFSKWSDEQVQHDGLAFDSPSSVMVQPSFIAHNWGPCSTTCGPGVSTRTVECVAMQGVTSNIIKLPDYECEGSTKPNSFQPCQERQCPLSESVLEPPERGKPLVSLRGFKWDYGEWTACSASCLGGKQKSTLKCVDAMRRTSVAWTFCDAKQRPIDLTRTCNNHPCPPAWDVGPMSECSHSCGGGLKTRKVRCIRQISRTEGAESTLILPDAQCSQPKPQDKEACGLVDCPVMWKVDQWSQCSASCGAGEQRREVVCEQRSAGGDVQLFNPPSACHHLEKPPTVQLCNLGSCFGGETVGSDSAKESKVSEDFEQQHNHHRKLTLNVGGRANLYQGTSIKVKCPVRNFDKNKIYWTKDGKKVKNTAHIKVSSNGALRIFHARMEDAGLYACVAGGAQGNVTLTFKPRENLKEEGANDSRLALSKTAADDGQSSKHAVIDAQLLQRIRQSLKQSGNFRLLERLSESKQIGNIKIDYATFEWSKCSQTECGKSDGAQVRQLKCRVTLDTFIGYVDDDICESFGVTRLPSSRSCGPPHCPRWETTEWSECSTSRCIRQAVSQQKRDVKCAYENGTEADFMSCDRGSRPKVKKECVNTNCTAEWRPSVWGDCSRTCGDGGVQMRLLRCVWHGTKKAAGRNCESSKRPSAIRKCVPGKELPACRTAPPTDSTFADSHCIDKSRYCEILKLFHSCDSDEIRQRCCHTCHYYDYEIVGARRAM